VELAETKVEPAEQMTICSTTDGKKPGKRKEKKM
jgi:hypothetical protein